MIFVSCPNKFEFKSVWARYKNHTHNNLRRILAVKRKKPTLQDQYHIFFCFQARQKLRRGVGSLSFPFPPFWTFSPPRASYHASILPFLPKNRRPSHLCSTANERGFFLKICDVEHGVYTKQFGLVFREEENNVVSSHYFLRGLFQRTHKTMKHGYVTCVVGHECVQSDFGTKRITNDGNKMSYCIRYKHKQTI